MASLPTIGVPPDHLYQPSVERATRGTGFECRSLSRYRHLKTARLVQHAAVEIQRLEVSVRDGRRGELGAVPGFLPRLWKGEASCRERGPSLERRLDPFFRLFISAGRSLLRNAATPTGHQLTYPPSNIIEPVRRSMSRSPLQNHFSAG